MIRKMELREIPVCAALIRASFATVAEEFGITRENAPRFTAFATDEYRLQWHFEGERRPMYVYCENRKIIGYYSLLISGETCELNNLCVAPDCRHKGIGRELLLHAFRQAKIMGCEVMHIGIVEENHLLRQWYKVFGFAHTGTKKYDFFPFTCGYMEKKL